MGDSEPSWSLTHVNVTPNKQSTSCEHESSVPDGLNSSGRLLHSGGAPNLPRPPYSDETREFGVGFADGFPEEPPAWGLAAEALADAKGLTCEEEDASSC